MSDKAHLESVEKQEISSLVGNRIPIAKPMV